MVRYKARNVAKQVSNNGMMAVLGAILENSGLVEGEEQPGQNKSLSINRPAGIANTQVTMRVGSAVAGESYRKDLIRRNRGKSSLEGCQLQNDIRSSRRWNCPG